MGGRRGGNEGATPYGTPDGAVPLAPFAVALAYTVRRCRVDPTACDRVTVFETLHRPLDWEKVPSLSRMRGPIPVVLEPDDGDSSG